MTGTRNPKNPTPPPGNPVYLAIAAGIVVLVGGLAVVFGIVRAPALDGLTDAQRADLPGGIAWTQFNEREGCTDLMVARPDGEARSIACSTTLDEVVGWTDEGLMIVTGWGSGLEIRDPVTGEVTSTPFVDSMFWEPEEERSDDVTAERVAGKLLVTLPSGSPIWEVEADARYEVGIVSISPDGEWAAMTDSAERLLVVRADGSEPPAVWATGLQNWSRAYLTWEGAEPPPELPFWYPSV
jgi:hypothetical protein